eukprot:4273772-Prymnesium_polylepis.1
MLFSRLARLVVLATCVDFSGIESRTPAARIRPQAPYALLRLRVVGPLPASCRPPCLCSLCSCARASRGPPSAAGVPRR